MGFYIKFHPNQQLNEKAKTSNNGSFLKLIKTLTARVLSSLKSLGLTPSNVENVKKNTTPEPKDAIVL